MMRAIRLMATGSVALLVLVPAAVAGSEAEPTEAPLGPPVVFEDPAGDTAEGAPDMISCGVSEPWESVVRFTLEFAEEPPLSYDLATMSTDELWVVLAFEPDAAMPDDIEYILGVHGATLQETVNTGSTLFDTNAPEGDEVFWSVVDVAVDGPTLTLSVDRKLIGDPDALRFFAWAGAEDDGSGEAYDSCPDEEVGAGEYVLYRR